MTVSDNYIIKILSSLSKIFINTLKGPVAVISMPKSPNWECQVAGSIPAKNANNL